MFNTFTAVACDGLASKISTAIKKILTLKFLNLNLAYTDIIAGLILNSSTYKQPLTKQLLPIV